MKAWYLLPLLWIVIGCQQRPARMEDWVHLTMTLQDEAVPPDGVPQLSDVRIEPRGDDIYEFGAVAGQEYGLRELRGIVECRLSQWMREKNATAWRTGYNRASRMPGKRTYQAIYKLLDETNKIGPYHEIAKAEQQCGHMPQKVERP